MTCRPGLASNFDEIRCRHPAGLHSWLSLEARPWGGAGWPPPGRGRSSEFAPLPPTTRLTTWNYVPSWAQASFQRSFQSL